MIITDKFINAIHKAVSDLSGQDDPRHPIYILVGWIYTSILVTLIIVLPMVIYELFF